MHLVNGLVGCLFVVFALLHMSAPEPVYWMVVFGGGAFLAFGTVIPEISLGWSRVLAIITTAAMFFYFAEFFLLAPTLTEGWYQDGGWFVGAPLHAIALLFSAFSMIFILSDYSCRLKADCRELRAQRRGAFFSVPEKLENHTNLTR